MGVAYNNEIFGLKLSTPLHVLLGLRVALAIKPLFSRHSFFFSVFALEDSYKLGDGSRLPFNMTNCVVAVHRILFQSESSHGVLGELGSFVNRKRFQLDLKTMS